MNKTQEIRVKEVLSKSLKEFPRMMHLRSLLDENDCFLLANPASIQYFTGFKAHDDCSVVLVPYEGKPVIVSDERYKTQIEEEADLELFDVFMTVPPEDYLDALKREIPAIGSRLYIEEKYLSAGQLLQIKEFWPEVEIIPSFNKTENTNLVLDIRAVKEEREILLIKEAIRITEKALEETFPYIKVGVPENDIAAEISYRQKKAGAAGDAFSFQVLAGSHSAWPHGRASGRKIKKGDLLQFDIGCIYSGYYSDISRVTVVGSQPTEKQVAIYQIVRDIQERMITRIKPGVKLDELDREYRDLLQKAGYGAQHSLGHGVGLQIHERPVLSVSKAVAAVNQVFTVEPGIYIPGWGGVRIEDMVLVTEDGHEVLTKFPKDLLTKLRI